MTNDFKLSLAVLATSSCEFGKPKGYYLNQREQHKEKRK